MKEDITATEVINSISQLNEMANMGGFDDCKVVINSEDHEPPHVHILKGRELVAKIEIPVGNVKNQTDLKVLKKGKLYKEYILSDFVKWGIQQSKKLSKYKNFEACSEIWNLLHTE